MFAQVIPGAGDFIAAGASLVVLAANPSWGNAGSFALDVFGAAIPLLPALGTISRMEALRDGATVMKTRLLPRRAGPVGHISPSEVVGKTPAEIEVRAKQLGLSPKGPNPFGGRGAYVDPATNRDRVEVHPNSTVRG